MGYSIRHEKYIVPILRVTPEQWDEQYRSGSWDRLKEFTAHYAIIAELIRKYECKTILDVGCGEGRLLHFLYDIGRYGYFGLDISGEAIKKLPLRSAIYDSSNYRPMNTDCIVFCESLYYMNDPVELLIRYLGFARFAALSISVMPKTRWLIEAIADNLTVLEDFHLSYGEHEHRIFMLKGKNG